MIKVIIADDEMLEREVYKIMINRHFPQLKIVGEAETGRQAVEMYDIHKPELMLMDVKMPGLNGIEAIEEIRKRNRDTKFIVISAYDFFDYAKEAIKFDVEDYLLKPVIEDVFITVITKVLIKIKDEKKLSNKKLELQERIRTIEPILENECIFSVMMGDGNKVKLYTSLLGINVSTGYVAIGMLNESSFTTMDDINHSFVIKKVQEYIKNNMPELRSSLIGNFIANKMILIFPVENDEVVGDGKQRVYEEMLTIRNTINKRFNTKMYFGISQAYENILDITDAYNQALTVINNIDSFGIDIINYGDISSKVDKQFFYPYEMEKQLIEKIRLGFTEQALQLFINIFDYTIECLKGDVDRVKLELLQLYFALSRMVYESDDDLPGLKDFVMSREKYYNLNTTKRMYHLFEEDIKSLCSKFSDLRNKQVKDIVFNAVKYIKQNYMKEITLEEIAKVVAVTPNYFSRLFKNELNQNFITYLTYVRIEAAKELIRTTNKNISDVCWEVGYNDPNYFAKVFKKTTGVTPSEFKDKAYPN